MAAPKKPRVVETEISDRTWNSQQSWYRERVQTIKLLSDKAGTWNAGTANRIAEIITESGYSLEQPVAPDKPWICCPHCGETDPDEFGIHDTCGVNFNIVEVSEEGTITLGKPDYDENDRNYVVTCNQCTHSGDPSSFGMDHDINWEFEE